MASGAASAEAKPAASGGAATSAKPQASPTATLEQTNVTCTPGSAGTAGSAVGAPAKSQIQMNAQHTGRSPFAGPRTLSVVRKFADPVVSDPVTQNQNVQSDQVIGADGTIYLSDFPGALTALVDGPASQLTAKWTFHQPKASAFHATPAVASDGSVLEADTNPETKSLVVDVRDGGQAAWTCDLGPGRITSSITVAPDGTVYAISGNGKLGVIAPNGTLKWQANAGPSAHAAPALAADGTVYLPSTDGNLYAVSPPASGANGTVKWKFAFGERPGIPTLPGNRGGEDGIGSSASPTIGPDGTIYVGANNSNFYAVNPDGSLKWKYETEPEIAGIWSTAALSADGRAIYFGANKGGVYALNTGTGKLGWQAELFGGSIFASPMLDKDGTLYVGTTTGHVFALDAGTGHQLAVADLGNAVWSTPSLRPDGSLVATDIKGNVYVLGA